MSSLFRVSRRGLIATTTFVILLLCFQLTLPFGDEPDFSVRAVELTETKWPAWTIYSWVPGVLESLETTSICEIEAGQLSLFAHVDYAKCTQDLSQVLLRVVLTLLVIFPLTLLIIWRRLGIELLKKAVPSSSIEINARLDALSLSLLVPGMIYYLSVLSPEQLTLAISLFVFLFWGNWLVIFSLVVMVASLDMGNATVIACFLAVFQLSSIAKTRLGTKVSVTFGLAFLGLVCIITDELMVLVKNIPLLADRANAILDTGTMADVNLREKYPIILRPVITLMTFFFSTPAGIKVIPIYVLAFVSIILCVIRLRRRYMRAIPRMDECRSCWLMPSVSAIYTILLFVFLLPGYANGKYYAFLLPFIVKLALDAFPNKTVYCFLTFCSVLVSVAAVLFWM